MITSYDSNRNIEIVMADSEISNNTMSEGIEHTRNIQIIGLLKLYMQENDCYKSPTLLST